MRAPFGARLADAVAARGPLCVGIDPHPELLEQWGYPVDAGGLDRFSATCVAAMAGDVAVLKPQSALFETHGSAGIAVLEQLIADCTAAGALVLLDAKRGDIGSTMTAYASAYLADGSPLAADAVTLSPYLGFGALLPAVELAERNGRGVFVLARTSNPEGVGVQLADTGGGRSVAQFVVDSAAQCNAGADPLGDVGVVIGATSVAGELDLSLLNGPILAPGFGAQGAAAADLPQVFGDAVDLVLPASAREILRAGPDPSALRDAALRTRDELAAVRATG